MLNLGQAFHSLACKRQAFYVIAHERSGTHLALNLCYRNLHIRQDFHDFRGWCGPYDRTGGREEHWRRTSEAWLSRPNKPGLIKSHCEAPVFARFLPKAKVVYVLRDPRDTLVSFYYYLNSDAFHLHNETAGDHRCSNFSEFLRRPLSDFLGNEFSAQGGYCNVMERWAAHAKGWMDAPDALIINYEDMLQDWRRVVRAVAWHVGAWPKLRMKNFSLGETGAILPRKGISGDWKNHFKTDDLAELDSALRRQSLSLDAWDARDARRRGSPA
jgi:hypothetical protein